MSLEIKVFGGTRVLVDGVEQDLGGRRPAEVLGLLVASGGETVDAEALASRLWRGNPPAAARTTLQGYVAGLRRVLDPGVAAREATVLVTHRSGYALRLRQEQVDMWRFLGLVRRAESARDTGDPSAVDVYREALATWEGHPLADVADVLEVGPVVVAAQERHLDAVESFAELRLEAGGCRGVVADLAEVARIHPVRERLQMLLARAMYASGRQAEALDVLRRTREHLADELGLDPSGELRDLEAAMLRQDRSLSTPAAPPGPRAATAAASTPLVGRDAELDALDAALHVAATGRGTTVVISGEAGIGKTALVEEFLRRSGAPSRWGRCVETSGVPPYWAWQQVLDGLPPVGGADAGARFAVGLEVSRRLRELAGDVPTVVVLDDLQWVDSDSLHALEVVLGALSTMPVLLVVTVRSENLTGASLATVLERAARTAGSRHLALRGLGVDDVVALVERLTGRAPSRDQADRLRSRSGGNPFFVSELAVLPSDAMAVPAGVRQVLGQRIRALSPGAQDLTGVLAVAGREVPAGLAATALGRTPADLAEPLEEAVGRGLVSQSPAGINLAHDLVRQVAHDDLGPSRRAALHGALAEALSGAAAASTAAIAVHRSEAAAGGVDRRAAEACLAAACEALDRAGDAEAHHLASRGLVHAPVEAAELAGDLHRVAGIAMRRLGLLEDARSELEAAARLARTVGDGTRLARAALGSAADGASGYWGSMGALYGADDRLLVEAVTDADVPDPLRSSAMSALAAHRACHGRDAADLVTGAAGCAGEDPEARARSLVAEFVVRWRPDQAEHRLRLARTLLGVSAGAPSYEATALHLLRCALLETSRPEESAAVSRRFTDLVERRGDGDQLLLDLWWHTGLALARGDYAQARRLADQAVASAPTVSPAAAAVTRTSRQAIEGIVAWHEHRLADVVPEVVDLAATLDPDWLTVLAQAHAQAGRRDRALEAVARLEEHPAEGTRAVIRTVLLAEVHLELGDADRAAELLPALEGYGDTMVLFWPGMTPLGPVALYRGGVLALLGHPAAEEELVRAVELSEAFGFTPYAARARRLLRELGAPAAQTS